MFIATALPPQDAPAPAPAASFDEQYQQARKLANDGQRELALAMYNSLLQRSPGNVDVLLGRGIVYARMDRWAESEADLKAAAAASPTYADIWSALGNMYTWSDAPAKAADAYTHLIALEPKDPAHRLARARAYRNAGRLADARAEYEQAAALGADSAAVAEAIAAMQPRSLNREAAAPLRYRWAAGLSASWTDHGDLSRWSDQTASVRHYGAIGSIGFEALRAHRFDQSDYAWALDGYTDLWTGAYANLRYQHSASARLFPPNSGRVEVWQSLGGGWEGSLSDDVLGFEGSRVNIYGISLGKYTGNFYLLLRHQSITSPGSHSNGDRFLGRYYYRGDADSYVEMTLNRGRSDDAQSLVGGQTRSGGGSLGWSHYLSEDWGLKASISASRAGVGENERSISVGVSHRW
jgi:YaiO family outer membrane protein